MEMVTPGQPGYDLCLNFSNTVDWRNGANRNDKLRDFDALVRWAVKAKLVREPEADPLIRSVGARRQETAILKRALQLRELIYTIFSSVAHDREPGDAEIEELNRFLTDSPTKTRLVRKDGGCEWGWEIGGGPQGAILWPIAKSAADLLTSDRLGRVRECANEAEGCGWVFMDKTRSQTRKWCDMSGCGNRSKVRAWYDRHERTKAA